MIVDLTKHNLVTNLVFSYYILVLDYLLLVDLFSTILFLNLSVAIELGLLTLDKSFNFCNIRLFFLLNYLALSIEYSMWNTSMFKFGVVRLMGVPTTHDWNLLFLVLECWTWFCFYAIDLQPMTIIAPIFYYLFTCLAEIILLHLFHYSLFLFLFYNIAFII